MCAGVHAVVVLLVGVVLAVLHAQNLAVGRLWEKTRYLPDLAQQFSMLATSKVSSNM